MGGKTTHTHTHLVQSNIFIDFNIEKIELYYIWRSSTCFIRQHKQIFYSFNKSFSSYLYFHEVKRKNLEGEEFYSGHEKYKNETKLKI